MDIGQLRDQIAAEIAAIDADIAGRQQQIEELNEANRTAQKRIEALSEAKTAVDRALVKLDEVGPLGVAPPPALSPSAEPRKRMPIKKNVAAMIANAGLVGITIPEMIAHHHQQTGETIKEMSLRGLLQKGRNDGWLERREDGRWRDKSRAAAAA